MGSCFSKHSEDDLKASARPSRPMNQRGAANKVSNKSHTSLSKAGQRLGGPVNGEQEAQSELGQSGREAAARAAELRYNQKQDNLASSKTKLKAMEKISKKDKGLA